MIKIPFSYIFFLLNFFSQDTIILIVTYLTTKSLNKKKLTSMEDMLNGYLTTKSEKVSMYSLYGSAVSYFLFLLYGSDFLEL